MELTGGEDGEAAVRFLTDVRPFYFVSGSTQLLQQAEVLRAADANQALEQARLLHHFLRLLLLLLLGGRFSVAACKAHEQGSTTEAFCRKL